MTGKEVRTIAGYVVGLLEYPRWCIDREVDFTGCSLQGRFEQDDARCAQCRFGKACRWLHHNSPEPMPDFPLPELINALQTAVAYLRQDSLELIAHPRHCDCDTCQWLLEASTFLRTHRHKT